MVVLLPTDFTAKRTFQVHYPFTRLARPWSTSPGPAYRAYPSPSGSNGRPPTLQFYARTNLT